VIGIYEILTIHQQDYWGVIRANRIYVQGSP